MAEVHPFAAIRYAPEAGDLASLVCPPFDVITPEQQEALHARSPHNIVRVELGRTLPGDNQANRYTRAAEQLHQWLREGALHADQAPAIYVVRARFRYAGRERAGYRLFARVRLEPFGRGIRPHEVTLPGPIEDRLRLLRACRVNVSPVMSLFRLAPDEPDPLAPLARGDPDFEARDVEGVDYSGWVVSEPRATGEVAAFFRARPVYIAEGHHRYTTALAYRDERLAAGAGSEDGCNYVLMTLTASNDDSLVLLPTYRLLRQAPPARDVERLLRAGFEIERLARPDEEEWQRIAAGESERQSIGVYGLEPATLWLLRPRDPEALRSRLPRGRCLGWLALSAALLHELVLPAIVPPDEADVTYPRTFRETIQAVDNGENALAFLLPPPNVSAVLDVADAGERMPPKSTYFYPQTPTGLVLNPL